MKRIILSVLCLAGFAIANGQRLVGEDPNYKRKVRLGIKGGLNLATLTGSDDDFNSGFSSTSGGSLVTPFSSGIGVFLNSGMAAQIELHKKFSLQPEISFQQTGTVYGGGKVNYQGYLFDMSAKVSINYLSMNTLGRFSVGNEKTRFIILAGPYVAYAISALESVTITYGGQSQSESSSVHVGSGGVSALDIGGTIGAGIAINAGKGDLVIDVRYSRGFKDISDNGGVTLPSSYKPSYNSVVSLNVSYLFCLNCD